MQDTLIAYFSKSGRTRKIAEQIANEINAPLHEILTEKTYPRTYFMTILESRREFKRNEKPKLASPKIEELDSFRRIILGFPIWFWTCPMAVVSWLEEYDFTGKEIYPFCTSGSSSCDKATAKIRELCPGSTVHDGIKANTIDGARIREWLK
ncbi:MAG: NAD(P)H-dependent oxidoreductase [Synergistaceae bacterium]|nr:NAD(P)H-dependent oxidoreductase [Synergistaceae bacterium]